MKTEICDLAIIGAGASGLVCAISAAQKSGSLKIVLLENKDRVGKKILATGNGKCNLSNTDNDVVKNYYSSDIPLVEKVFNKHNYENNISFFNNLGLVCRTDSEGRIYPYSQHSASVLDALRNECERLNIETKCSIKINNVKKEQGKFKIVTDNEIIICSSLVIATGGMSYVNGKELSGYDILKKLGHSLTKIYPSLVPLKAKFPIKALKGIRFPATVTLCIDGKKVQSEQGEVQFTEQGLSGIAVMQLSQRISRGLAQRKKENYTISLDLMPGHSSKNIAEILQKKITTNGDASVVHLLHGIFHKMLSLTLILTALKTDIPENVSFLTSKQIEAIIKTIKCFEFEIADTTGFANAQVTGGGARLNQFNVETMESTITNGLYACGEVLDVVGACGGFNLNWAWSSGIIAGKSIAKRSKIDA